MPNQVSALVGTVKGAFLFHSDESRQSWSVTGPHLSGWEVSCLYGERRGSRILAGTCHMAYGASFRVSDDLGETWRELPHSPAYAVGDGRALHRIWQVVSGPPSKPETLYAGVDEAGLFVSRDRGETWAEVEGLNACPGREAWTGTKGGLCLHSILVNPDNGLRLWVAVSDGGAYRTDDGGQTWEPCHRGLPRGRNEDDASENPAVVRGVHKIALDPLDSRRLVLQHHRGVYESTDGGDSWAFLGDGLPGGFGFPVEVASNGDLYVVPLDEQTRCFFEGRVQLYRRRKGGSAWEALAVGPPYHPHFAGVLRDSLALDPLDPTGITLGTTQGDLFASPDAGETWSILPGRYSRITAVKSWIR